MEFEPESLNVRNTVEDIAGGGYIVMDDGYGPRYINCELQISGTVLTDYALFRAEVFSLFTNLEPFYLIDTKVPSRRWHVRSDGSFTLGRKNKRGNYSLKWLCVNKYAESVATTSSVKEWDADVWAWDGTIDWDEDLQYSFAANNFIVKNLGNAPIDPREYELEIIIKATASSYLQIVNNTTGETYRYNGALSSTDTLVIKGVQTFKNGVSAFRNTNFKLLSLAVGNNSFTITGGTILSVAFNFRFLYK